MVNQEGGVPPVDPTEGFSKAKKAGYDLAAMVHRLKNRRANKETKEEDSLDIKLGDPEQVVEPQVTDDSEEIKINVLDEPTVPAELPDDVKEVAEQIVAHPQEDVIPDPSENPAEVVDPLDQLAEPSEPAIEENPDEDDVALVSETNVPAVDEDALAKLAEPSQPNLDETQVGMLMTQYERRMNRADALAEESQDGSMDEDTTADEEPAEGEDMGGAEKKVVNGEPGVETSTRDLVADRLLKKSMEDAFGEPMTDDEFDYYKEDPELVAEILGEDIPELELSEAEAVVAETVATQVEEEIDQTEEGVRAAADALRQASETYTEVMSQAAATTPEEATLDILAQDNPEDSEETSQAKLTLWQKLQKRSANVKKKRAKNRARRRMFLERGRTAGGSRLKEPNSVSLLKQSDRDLGKVVKRGKMTGVFLGATAAEIAAFLALPLAIPVTLGSGVLTGLGTVVSAVDATQERARAYAADAVNLAGGAARTWAAEGAEKAIKGIGNSKIPELQRAFKDIQKSNDPEVASVATEQLTAKVDALQSTIDQMKADQKEALAAQQAQFDRQMQQFMQAMQQNKS